MRERPSGRPSALALAAVSSRTGGKVIKDSRTSRSFSAEKPDVVVMECMAVQPQYQWISAHQMGKSDDGKIIVEDTHTSYLKKFGNPSKYSFINYSKYIIDVINSRFPTTEIKKNNNFRNKIYSISFFESMAIFKINSKKQ